MPLAVRGTFFALPKSLDYNCLVSLAKNLVRMGYWANEDDEERCFGRQRQDSKNNSFSVSKPSQKSFVSFPTVENRKSDLKIMCSTPPQMKSTPKPIWKLFVPFPQLNPKSKSNCDHSDQIVRSPGTTSDSGWSYFQKPSAPADPPLRGGCPGGRRRFLVWCGIFRDQPETAPSIFRFMLARLAPIVHIY